MDLYGPPVCELCGISFNIARIRKPGEPDRANCVNIFFNADFPPEASQRLTLGISV